MTKTVVTGILGKPSSKNTIRGKELWTWGGYRTEKRDHLFLVFDKDQVSDIHITSAKFQACGISTASSYAEVVQAYPQGEEDYYTLFETGKNRLDWIVKDRGITFTFAGDDSGPMIRIAVHRPGYHKFVGYSEGDDLYWYPD